MRVDLVGRMTVATDRGSVDEADFGGRQARVVFALLVAERRRAVPREELAATLWGEKLPPSFEAALRVVVSKVRSVLARAGLSPVDALTNAFGCYQIHLPPGATVDLELAAAAVIAAEDALTCGRVEEARTQAIAARAIAGRPFLAGEASDWVERAREKLTGILLRSLEVLAQAEGRRGDTAAALEAAEAAVDLDPFRESAHRCLMAAHAEAGNRAAALRAYERCRRLLAEELGVPPSPETEAAYAALLASDVLGAPSTITEGHGPAVVHAAHEVPVPLPEVLGASATAGVVGREPELLCVERAWALTGDGRRQVVLVAGEAGMGKTTLAATVARQFHAQGATVLYGRCDRDVLVPYQPFVEAVGRYVQVSPPERLRQEVGPGGADLARLVVDLPRRLPELVLPTPAEPETERHRMFGAVAAFLDEVARRAPLVMVFDDFQWAATGSQVLLRHVLRALEAAPVLAIVCVRDDEIDADSGLGGLLGELAREGAAHRLQLSGLDEKAVAELLNAAAGVVAKEGCLARTIQEQTAGNPLFVVELLGQLGEATWTPASESVPGLVTVPHLDVPQTVYEVIGRRYARVSDDARHALDVAAVIGERFAVGLLGAVSRIEEERLITALEEGTRARLIQELQETIGSYSFVHALSRDVVYTRLSGARRAYLHRRVGQAIEESGAGAISSLAELAHHFEVAGETEKAVRYSIRAGDDACSCLGYEAAAYYYGRALRLGLHEPTSRQERCRTLMALAAAHRKAGHVAPARDAYLEATIVARDLGDPEALAGCALGLGGGGRGVSAWIADEVRISLLEEALSLLDRDDSELRVKVMAQLAKALYFSEEAERRDALAGEAVDVARRLGTPTILADALSATRVIRWGPGNTELRLAYADEVLALSEKSGDRELIVRARLARLADLAEIGDRNGFDGELDSVLELAAGLRQPYYMWRAISWDAQRALVDGRTGDVELRAADALAIWRGNPHPDALHTSRTQLAATAMLEERASEAVDLARPCAELHPMIPSYRCVLAWFLALDGRLAEARAEFERFATDGFVSPPVDAHWLPGVAALAEACALLGDRPRAEVLYELLRPFADRMLVFDPFGGGGGFWGATAHQLGVLAGMMGRQRDAERHFEAAVDASVRFGAPWCAARSEQARRVFSTSCA